MTSPREGVIDHISPPLEVSRKVLEYLFYKQNGDKIGMPTNNIERIGHVRTISDDLNEEENNKAKELSKALIPN